MAETSKKLVYNEIKELSFLDELLEWNKDKTIYYWIIVICTWLSVGLAFYHLFVAVYGTPEGRSFRSIHLSAMMVLAVFIYPLFRNSIKDPLFINNDRKGNLLRVFGYGYDLTIILSIIFVQLWTTWDVENFMMRYGDKYIGDIIVGSILIFLVLDATRRAVGWPMIIPAQAHAIVTGTVDLMPLSNAPNMSTTDILVFFLIKLRMITDTILQNPAVIAVLP